MSNFFKSIAAKIGKLTKKQKRGIAACIAVVLILAIGIPVGLTLSAELKFTRIDGGYSVGAGAAAKLRTEIVVPETHNGKPVIAIGNEAFSGYNKLISITLPTAVIIIGDSAFAGCSGLTSISLPNIASIGDRAFAGCSGLISISIPKVASIGDGAFVLCSRLTSISLPKVASIGHNAFNNCSGLISIDVEQDNQYYSSINDVLYNKAKTVLIACPSGKTGEIIVPNSVTRIGDAAFNNCSGLTSISLPKVTIIGNQAFLSCNGLTTVTLPKVTIIGESAFSNCSGLTSILLPKVTSIGNYAFMSCSELTSITLPTVTSIGTWAFYGCVAMTFITLNEVTIIGDFAFEGWTEDQTIYVVGYTAAPDGWSVWWNMFCSANVVWEE
ncbi:MAG: leucine-rich repeat domain-containing protein [Clostridiales bacterium]|nr:leucine-rich repeat domain-containing protein [Clostridiales bacterium]